MQKFNRTIKSDLADKIGLKSNRGMQAIHIPRLSSIFAMAYYCEAVSPASGPVMVTNLPP